MRVQGHVELLSCTNRNSSFNARKTCSDIVWHTESDMSMFTQHAIHDSFLQGTNSIFLMLKLNAVR